MTTNAFASQRSLSTLISHQPTSSTRVAFVAHFNALLDAAMRYVGAVWSSGRWMRETAMAVTVVAAPASHPRDSAPWPTTTARLTRPAWSQHDAHHHEGDVFAPGGDAQDEPRRRRHSDHLYGHRDLFHPHDDDEDDDADVASKGSAGNAANMPSIDWNSPAGGATAMRVRQNFAEAMIKHTESLRLLCCSQEPGWVPFHEKRLRHGWGAFRMEKVGAMADPASPNACSVNSWCKSSYMTHDGG